MNGTSKAVIDLLKGWPNPTLLPAAQIKNASTMALSNPAVSTPALLYGPDFGYEPLREQIAKWLTQFYRPPTPISTGRICITGGASQNMACILQVFSDPIYTRNVWMVSPTYFLAMRIFEDSGFHGRLRSVPEDEQGIDIRYLRKAMHKSEEKAIAEGNTKPTLKPVRPWSKIYRHFIYAVPTFSNPSSVTMSLERRQELVRVAREFDACIITDDVYDQLQWSGNTSISQPRMEHAILPRVVDIDRTLDGGTDRKGADGFGNTVSNGTFSKMVGPGCRTGWSESTEKFAWGNSQVGSTRSGGAPSQLISTFMADLLGSGGLQSHIFNSLQPTYARRYQNMMAAIEKHLTPLGVTLPQTSRSVIGGYFIWLTLPEPLQAEEVAVLARRDENLILAPGHIFAVTGDEEVVNLDQQVRVCFSWEQEDQLGEGIRRLGHVISSLQSFKGQQGKTNDEPPGDSTSLVEQYR
ncbi:hypothetical protein N7G274_010505 [Stereocaulon virgatum]|uniref:Aminotransferase class I/classII large domain-containing protein n=1 Tax=Stereocaulon virgatum TaxID=373712 RepID=A0ABR3ZVM2_9LECA